MNAKRYAWRGIRPGHFVEVGDGTVIDIHAGLMWAAVDSGLEDRSGTPDGEDWWEATAWCERFRGGGHTDWRMPTLSELKTLYAGLLGQPVEAFERDFWREGDHPRVAGEVNVQTASGQWVNLQSACNRENGVPIWIDGWIWSSDVRPPDAANLYFHNGRIAWDAQSFRDRSVRALPVRALASTIAHAALNHPPSRRPP